MPEPHKTPPSDDSSNLPCEEVRDELHSLLMDELSDEESKPILDHLSICSECRMALAQHSKLLGHLVAHFPDLNVPADSGDH